MGRYSVSKNQPTLNRDYFRANGVGKEGGGGGKRDLSALLRLRGLTVRRLGTLMRNWIRIELDPNWIPSPKNLAI